MVFLKKYWIYMFVIALAVFFWGYSEWHAAHYFVPDEPRPRKYMAPTPSPVPPSAPLARYQNLLGGKIFFGTPITATRLFQSKLVIWGLIKGSTALVGTNPYNSQEGTQIAKVGDVIAGEKILAIGEDYILVRNETGEGKVNYSK